VRVAVTGGAGFVGRALVERLRSRGDTVVALVRDPARAAHLAGEGVELVRSDLSDTEALTRLVHGSDGLIHAAGRYEVGIRPRDHAGMWDANVGTTERVLDAAIAAGVGRIVDVSTVNVFGNTHGRLVDETFRRDPRAGFLSVYDETKYRADEAAAGRAAAGAPLVIAMPSQVYGPHDHSLASRQLEHAFRGRLRYRALDDVGVGWVHVHDLADGLLAALDRGRTGERYVLSGPAHRLRDALRIAARAGGRRLTPLVMPTGLVRLVAPLNDAVGGLPGMVPNLRETISASAGVTYWATHEKATLELGWRPRPLDQGVRDTWASA